MLDVRLFGGEAGPLITQGFSRSGSGANRANIQHPTSKIRRFELC
jgi:hypothetical protein